MKALIERSAQGLGLAVSWRTCLMQIAWPLGEWIGERVGRKAFQALQAFEALLEALFGTPPETSRAPPLATLLFSTVTSPAGEPLKRRFRFTRANGYMQHLSCPFTGLDRHFDVEAAGGMFDALCASVGPLRGPLLDNSDSTSQREQDWLRLLDKLRWSWQASLLACPCSSHAPFASESLQQPQPCLSEHIAGRQPAAPIWEALRLPPALAAAQVDPSSICRCSNCFSLSLLRESSLLPRQHPSEALGVFSSLLAEEHDFCLMELTQSAVQFECHQGYSETSPVPALHPTSPCCPLLRWQLLLQLLPVKQAGR
eukprot:CAMPEP_0115112778 /NCGR_PEP_ID=MMETSP0227-20121206/40896_1 /TAXON_ID=89957 /ORGANISM="Polarella glacialis, Strain CCMP 1383" /LENGTH=312 /DNA_ID=CAMNT_0002512517 /DNA_START=251 /DNA_END=1187 /DNA_ORIENTATION=-